jgi:hypothetical protein
MPLILYWNAQHAGRTRALEVSCAVKLFFWLALQEWL